MAGSATWRMVVLRSLPRDRRRALTAWLPGSARGRDLPLSLPSTSPRWNPRSAFRRSPYGSRRPRGAVIASGPLK